MAENPDQSIETILTFENRDMSEWSVIWSTTQIPGMDTATGTGRNSRRISGRRHLRLGSLVLGGLMTMHCRIPASALTGGIALYTGLFVLAVGGLGNPLRHFEVYLGQWSISGPGRAFRMIPMFDGIGIAICLNAIFRAIYCCVVAAIAAVYVMHSIADAKLPFTYCIDFNLKPYEPIIKDMRSLRFHDTKNPKRRGIFIDYDEYWSRVPTSTVGFGNKAWRNFTRMRESVLKTSYSRGIATCQETFSDGYPTLYSTPAYNFFYVEVVQFRSNKFGFNLTLCLFLGLVWGIIWILLVMERLRYNRIIWNNIYIWFIIIPWIWVVILGVTATCNIKQFFKSISKIFRTGAKEGVAAAADALEVAMYIHSASVGTEIITGKGLYHYASGHIDPNLNSENVLHSCLIVVLSILHSAGAALCGITDYLQPKTGYTMRESTLWVLPMYSKCTSLVGYSHLVSTLVFGGLMFSYITVAFVLLKTALHTIFEYKVKLVFVEQYVAGSLVFTCFLLSLVFATTGGVVLLDSMDAVMTGVAASFVCLLELCGLLYVYRSKDFLSDLSIATEENTCSTRLNTQWQIIPLIVIAAFVLKSVLMFHTEIPRLYLLIAIAPLAAVVISVPVRAIHNAIVFLRPTPRRGT